MNPLDGIESSRPLRRPVAPLRPRLAFLAFPLSTLLLAPAVFGATSLSQFGITWTFDRDYPAGRFANGDHWVVGPVTIVSISPRTQSNGGVMMHGSMVNPQVNDAQAYDSRIKSNRFAPHQNVAARMPLRLKPGTSLLSSESFERHSAGDKPQLKTIAILTVLERPAPPGSFRPPPVGTDKTLRWRTSQLDYRKLRSLRPVAHHPRLSDVERLFQRPWIEQGTTWVSRYLHPADNQPSYGREIAHTLALGLLSLQLDYSDREKETLLIRLVQYGIDIYGSARLGAVWPAGGGHNHGRKMPLLLAGTVLSDPDILSYGDGRRLVFQEDRQIWYVTQADVGRPLYMGDRRPREMYLPTDVGVAEWGEKHFPEPRWDGRNWNSYYRTIVGASVIGHVLTARLMGLVETWNWPATFDYLDRYWTHEHRNVSRGANSIQPFVAGMWSAYRHSAPAKLSDDNVATPIWHNLALPATNRAFTVTFDLLPSQNNMDGLVGVSSGRAGGAGDLVATVRLAPSGFIEATDDDGFRAATRVPYAAGQRYRVAMSLDPAARNYSVTVTPPGKRAVTLASQWRFRSPFPPHVLLDHLAFQSRMGYHAVLNVGTQQTHPFLPTAPPDHPVSSDSNYMGAAEPLPLRNPASSRAHAPTTPAAETAFAEKANDRFARVE